MVVTDHCARFRASVPKSQAHANHKVGYHAGQDMTVTVPAGVEAGGLFDVPLPEPRLPSLGE